MLDAKTVLEVSKDLLTYWSVDIFTEIFPQKLPFIFDTDPITWSLYCQACKQGGDHRPTHHYIRWKQTPSELVVINLHCQSDHAEPNDR